MPCADDFACLQAIERAAVGAAAFTGARDIDEDLRVSAPQRHLRIGAEDHAVALQVLGGDFDRGFVVAHVNQTFVSHSAYLALRPFTMSKKALWIFSVMGPRVPLPSSMRSNSRIGVGSAAVPVKKASSQM